MDALLQYITEQLKKGYSPQQISVVLVGHGYSREMADQQVRKALFFLSEPKESYPWKMYTVVLLCLLVIGGVYYAGKMYGLPWQENPDDATSLLLFLSELRQKTENVLVLQQPETFTQRVGDAYELVCIVDLSKRPNVGEKTVLNAAQKDTSKNVFFVLRNKQFGFKSIIGYQVVGLTAPNGYTCAAVRNAWTSIRLTPLDSKVLAST